MLVVKASNGGAGTDVVETAVVDRPKLRRFQVSQGHPSPFGATTRDGGVNFAVYSANAVSVTLCLITLSDLEEVIMNSIENLLPISHTVVIICYENLFVAAKIPKYCFLVAVHLCFSFTLN